MSKQHIPMTVKARAVMEGAGGIKNLTPETLMEALKVDKQTAWSLMWQLKRNPNCGKAANGPYSKIANGHANDSKARSFIRPHSAAARLLRAVDNDLSSEEQAFLAVIQLIGVKRAEELLQDFRSQLTQDIKGVGE